MGWGHPSASTTLGPGCQKEHASTRGHQELSPANPPALSWESLLPPLEVSAKSLTWGKSRGEAAVLTKLEAFTKQYRFLWKLHWKICKTNVSNFCWGFFQSYILVLRTSFQFRTKTHLELWLSLTDRNVNPSLCHSRQMTMWPLFPCLSPSPFCMIQQILSSVSICWWLVKWTKVKICLHSCLHARATAYMKLSGMDWCYCQS